MSLWDDAGGTSKGKSSTTLWDQAKGKSKGKSRSAKLPGTKKTHKGGGWHNPITGGASWLEDSILGLPGAVKALGVGTANSIENLGEDAKRALHLRNVSPIKDPPRKKKGFTIADILASIEADYAYRWSPFNPRDFHPIRGLQRNSETGFFPSLLDVGAVGAGALKGAASAGLIKEAPRSVVFRSPGAIAKGAKAADDPAAYVRPIHGSELSRRMKVGAVAAKKRLPKGVGEYYESMRHGRHTQITNLKGYTRAKLKNMRRDAAIHKMKMPEVVASHLRLQFPLMRDLQAYKASLADVDTAGPTLKLLNDEMVLDHFNAPSEKMLKYEGLTRKLGREHELYFPDSAAMVLDQRRFLPMLFARGFRYERVPTEVKNIGQSVAVPGRRGKWREGKVEAIHEDGTVTLRFGTSVKTKAGERKNATYTKRVQAEVLHSMDERLVGPPIQRPRTPEEAAARLAKLEDVWDDLVDRTYKQDNPMEPGEIRAEHQRRFGVNARIEGMRKSGDWSKLDRQLDQPNETRPIGEWDSLEDEGAWSRKPEGQEGSAQYAGNIKDELKAQIEARLHRWAENGTAPEAQQLKALLDEMDQLREAFTAKGEASIGMREGFDPAAFGTMRGQGTLHPHEVIADLRAELDAAGVEHPTYIPHKAVEEGGMGMGTGGLGIPKDSRFLKNRAVLLAMGRVAFDIDTLTPRYMKTIRWANYVDRHNELLAAGIRMDPNNLPANWRQKYVLVRQRLDERLSHTQQTKAEFEARLDQHLDLGDEQDASLAHGPTQQNELTTLVPDEALVGEDGFIVAVPKGYAKRIVGEYKNVNQATKWIWDKPTDVWRAVVLNLRVGWLVNNIVGNSFLYLLKNSGPEGMAAYARALRRSEGGKIFTEDQMMELFPDQWHGTFSGTQIPGGMAGRITTSNYNPVNPLRNLDKYTERGARIAYASRLAAKQLKIEMKGQTKKWNELAEDALKNDPKMAERISEEVNAGLGDYFSMSEFERNKIRRIAPFYAWYKAITRITVMLPIDYPGRALILSKLGQIGMEFGAEEGGPPWLKGRVGLWGGNSLSTQAMNPLGTDVGIVRGFGAGDWYAEQQRLGLLHPFINALMQAQSRRGGGWHGLPAYPVNVIRELGDQGRNLPPGRLFFPPKRASYEGSDYLRELYSYLGIPIKNVQE